MATKKTLNAKNLESLGAKRLAELLMDLSMGNAAVKRWLRLELAGAQSSGDAAHEIRKRLATIARSESFVDWDKIDALVADLDTQLRAIVEHVSGPDPSEAIDLLWRFMALASPVFDRCDDGGGAVSDTFDHACETLGEIAAAATTDPSALADQAFRALQENDHGQYDDLITLLAPALGQVGLAHLKNRITAPVTRREQEDREGTGQASSGAAYADERDGRLNETATHLALMHIADAQGDVDAFIALHDEKARKIPSYAAGIAQRLLAAGRPEEALEALDAAESNRGIWTELGWVNARAAVLEALGQTSDAQAVRWSCFEHTLSIEHLRAHLERLPDFDDVEAEERAIAYVAAYPKIHNALAFLIRWPALDKAASMVLQRSDELDGNRYALLTPAADALAGKHPLAATLVLRAMIDFTLKQTRSTRYKHAVRHLADCKGLADSISEFIEFEPHDAYAARLRREHGRKRLFWSLAA